MKPISLVEEANARASASAAMHRADGVAAGVMRLVEADLPAIEPDAEAGDPLRGAGANELVLLVELLGDGVAAVLQRGADASLVEVVRVTGHRAGGEDDRAEQDEELRRACPGCARCRWTFIPMQIAMYATASPSSSSVRPRGDDSFFARARTPS